MNDRSRIIHSDCLDALRAMADCSVDAVVTDPPYHLINNGGGPSGKGADNAYSRAKAGASSTGFMGMKWDGGDISFRVQFWAECLRVLKPGGHLLAFSSARTYHRMACAIEDAGFEVRDQIMWIYGSGFPKSMNIAKQLEKVPVEDTPDWVECHDDRAQWLANWSGWGTALKPAHEPICMARKPLAGTVAQNVMAHGTGGINIDGCRVPTATDADADAKGYAEKFASVVGLGSNRNGAAYGEWTGERQGSASPLGRWPANVVHDGSPEVVAMFPDSTGAGGSVPNVKVTGYGDGIGTGKSDYLGGERTKVDSGSGSAARFFYSPKASRKDRNEGIGGCCEPAVGTGATMRERENADWSKRNGNHHPTVKPTDLMRYLCRLVTPPGGLVLDPFMGSGSTGKAAVLEGFRFVGIEREADYVAIATARIQAAIKQRDDECRQMGLDLAA